jgi:protein-S-isoprenylcysteine O-methyltransferase Ste14
VDNVAEPEATSPDANTSGIRVPPPLYYIGAFLAGVALEVIFPINWPSFGVRLAVTVLAAGAWLALDGAAMVSFRRAGTSLVPMKPDTALVTSGPYRFTRNPMYLGMVFLYLAFAFAFGVIWAVAFLPAVVLIVDRFVIAREEPHLERKFGPAYRDYRARVRRWV